MQQCRNLFDTIRSPNLSEDTKTTLRQSVCQLRGIRHSVCCQPDQVERIEIHRNALLLPLECGVAKRSDPTNTAVPAGVFEFPWIAMIRSSKATPDKDPYCTGSLINNRYVLTSAGCLNAREHQDLYGGQALKKLPRLILSILHISEISFAWESTPPIHSETVANL